MPSRTLAAPISNDMPSEVPRPMPVLKAAPEVPIQWPIDIWPLAPMFFQVCFGNGVIGWRVELEAMRHHRHRLALAVALHQLLRRIDRLVDGHVDEVQRRERGQHLSSRHRSAVR